MKRPLALILALVFMSGCDRRDRFAGPDSSSVPEIPPVPARAAYLSISDMAPEAGAVVVVAGTLKVGDSLSLGSFRVRLSFDSTKLRFIDDISGQDMMRVVNPLAGDIVIVGASSSASSDGRLFALRMRVDDPAGISSLVLRIDEMNDVAFTDQRATITNAAAIVHDRSLMKLASPR